MRASDPRDDAVLLAATAGDPDAFATFYARYSEPVFAYFLTRTRRADLAADLTAETFAAALAAAGRHRGGESGAPWLFGIAHNKLVDSLRRRRVEDGARRRLGMEPLAFSADELAQLEARLDLEEHERWLADALAALAPEQRAAVMARVVDERPYAEIAAETACSEAVVRQRVSRGLARLRARLSEER